MSTIVNLINTIYFQLCQYIQDHHPRMMPSRVGTFSTCPARVHWDNSRQLFSMAVGLILISSLTSANDTVLSKRSNWRTVGPNRCPRVFSYWMRWRSSVKWPGTRRMESSLGLSWKMASILHSLISMKIYPHLRTSQSQQSTFFSFCGEVWHQTSMSLDHIIHPTEPWITVVSIPALWMLWVPFKYLDSRWETAIWYNCWCM